LARFRGVFESAGGVINVLLMLFHNFCKITFWNKNVHLGWSLGFLGTSLGPPWGTFGIVGGSLAAPREGAQVRGGRDPAVAGTTTPPT